MLKKKQLYNDYERFYHYYISLGNCIGALIEIEENNKKGVYDLDILKQMKAAYKRIKK